MERDSQYVNVRVVSALPMAAQWYDVGPTSPSTLQTMRLDVGLDLPLRVDPVVAGEALSQMLEQAVHELARQLDAKANLGRLEA